jgi:putative endonuclease
MAWMYILKCSDGSLYVGSTKSLTSRLFQHQQGRGAIYTANRLPVELVYFEEYRNVAEAFAREKQVQNWSHAKREALIQNSFCRLPELAKKNFRNKQ